MVIRKVLRKVVSRVLGRVLGKVLRKVLRRKGCMLVDELVLLVSPWGLRLGLMSARH